MILEMPDTVPVKAGLSLGDNDVRVVFQIVHVCHVYTITSANEWHGAAKACKTIDLVVVPVKTAFD